MAVNSSKTCSRAGESTISAGSAGLHRNFLRQGVLLLILSIPSLYIFLTIPPLWRDEDAFNEIVSSFAPKGIIHYLPGYCLGGRLIVSAGSMVASLLAGHGIPHFSITAPSLTDTGICALIVAQHLFLILSLFYLIGKLSDHFPIKVLISLAFALTPWIYIYANCIGSEAFSNPLVFLVSACGWNLLKAPLLTRPKVLFYFGLLLAAALTRQTNVLLATCLPIALLPLAGKELILGRAAANLTTGPSRFRYSRRFLIFSVVGLAAIGTSLFVQQTMCWVFRVPFRSTYGETFQYRLGYLGELPEQERSVILARISTKLSDPVTTEALDALNRSLNRGEDWANMFLYYKIDEILAHSGFDEKQNRAFQVDLKLNRIAACALLSADPRFLEVVWASFVVSPFFAQTDLASAPFELTDWLQKRLANPRYERIRGLSSFQRPEGYYNAAWQRISYLHLFERIPMLEMACVTIAFAIIFAGLAITGVFGDPGTEEGICYAIGMVVVALLISVGTCLSTYFQARLYLPLYSLFQMGMLLVLSLAANVLVERRARFKRSRKMNPVPCPGEAAKTFSTPENVQWLGHPKRTS